MIPGYSVYKAITIVSAPAISAFAASPAAINLGQSSATLNWSVSGGLLTVTLNQGLGAVAASGSRVVTPTSTLSYTLTASNVAGTSTATCTVTVNPPPVVGAIAIPAFDADRVVSLALPPATDPDVPITYTATSLPLGLTFNAGTRTLDGAVSTSGTRTFTYTATDSKGAWTNKLVALTVNPHVPSQADFTTTIHYDYDDQGRLKTLTYPMPIKRQVVYVYDDLDRVKKVTQNGQDVMREIPGEYDDWGNPILRQYGSGAFDQWTYNTSGTQLTNWAVGIVNDEHPEYNSRKYAYDAADRLIQAGEWGTLNYDLNSRLIEAVATRFSIDNVLVHDAYNNNTSSVTTSQVFGMEMFTFDFPMTAHGPLVDHNALPGSGRSDGFGGITAVDYSNYGEITNVAIKMSDDAVLSMAWDPLGRMSSTKFGLFEIATESNQYAASGLRVTRIDSLKPALNRAYAYTGAGQLLSEYTANPSPAWSRDVIYLGNLAIAEVDSTGVHELHTDHQGTPRVITGAVGTMASPNGGSQAYGPYGELLTNFTSGYIPLTGYTGHLQTEPTGLIYMRGRFYSPAWHRFMNSDQGVDPGGLNQFAYVAGNPMMDTDPSGMIISSMNDADAKQAAQDRAQKARDGVKQWANDNGIDAKLAQDYSDIAAADSETFLSDDDVISRKFNHWKAETNLCKNIFHDALEMLGFARTWSRLFAPEESPVTQLTAPDIKQKLSQLSPGKNTGVRVVGSSAEMDNLYNDLATGGTPINRPGYNGQAVQLSDGTQVGLRDSSLSGGSTIDVRMPDGSITKVHIQ